MSIRKIVGETPKHEQLTALGFYKVSQSGGTFVTAHYWNPETFEEASFVARDYDYDGSRDNDSIYYAPVDEKVLRDFQHYNGMILEGDTVVVIKGRKIPLMTQHVVHHKRDVYDRYGRVMAVYLVFTDGLQTNENNCMRVFDVEHAG